MRLILLGSPYDGCITLRPNRYNRYWCLDQLLDAVDISLRLNRKFIELANILSGLQPAIHLNILRLMAIEPACISLPIMDELTHLTQGMVTHPNLDFWQGIQHIQFGQGNLREAIQLCWSR